MNEDLNYYLSEGDVSQRTTRLKKIVRDISGNDLVFIRHLINWMDDYFLPSPKGEEREKLLYSVYLNRTVNEVVKSRFTISCSEVANVFAVLCRIKGIPAKFVQTVSRRSLEMEDSHFVKQHAFVKVFVDRAWIVIDPFGKLLFFDPKGWERMGCIFFVEGIDNQDCFDKDGNHYSWTSLKQMIADAKKFRRKWKKERQ